MLLRVMALQGRSTEKGKGKGKGKGKTIPGNFIQRLAP
jgi:hypothetical protein